MVESLIKAVNGRNIVNRRNIMGGGNFVNDQNIDYHPC